MCLRLCDLMVLSFRVFQMALVEFLNRLLSCAKVVEQGLIANLFYLHFVAVSLLNKHHTTIV